MKNHNYDYLQRAHRICCEVASSQSGLNRTLLVEAATDIEAFCKHLKQPDIVNRLHAIRSVFLPETPPGHLELQLPRKAAQP